MPEYVRKNPHFSLCGLDCCLCPRFHTEGISRCPGCGGPGFSDKHPTCAVVTCSRKHGEMEHCFECPAYPCERYARPSEVDSFITYRNVAGNMAAARRDLASYLRGLKLRYECLQVLIENYNDGRSKGLYCLAAELLPLPTLTEIIKRIADDPELKAAPKKKAAEKISAAFGAKAKELGIELTLRRKEKT